MPDYKKTEQLFKEREISHLYHKPQAQLDDELFYAKVTNPETGQPFQWEDLTVSNRKFANGKKYPIKEVFQIVRVRRPDASEWLKSRGRILGLDQLGNEVEHSFTDPEVYFTPWTEYKIKKNAQNPDGPKERYCAAAGINERKIHRTQRVYTSI